MDIVILFHCFNPSHLSHPPFGLIYTHRYIPPYLPYITYIHTIQTCMQTRLFNGCTPLLQRPFLQNLTPAYNPNFPLSITLMPKNLNLTPKKSLFEKWTWRSETLPFLPTPLTTSHVSPFRQIALTPNCTHNSPILGLIHNKELALKAAEESANSNGSSRFERKISMNQLSNIERYTVWKGRVVG